MSAVYETAGGGAGDAKAAQALSPHADTRGERILAAAYDILAEKGIAGTRLLDLSRAGLSAETLAVRYGDLEGFFCAVIGWAARRAGIGPEMTSVAMREPAAALERLAVSAYHALFTAEALTIRRLMLSEGWKSDALAAAYDDAFRAPILAAVRKIADLANSKGVAPVEDVETFAAAFMGWLHADLEAALVGLAGPVDDKAQARRARALVRRLIAGFALRAKPARAAEAV